MKKKGIWIISAFVYLTFFSTLDFSFNQEKDPYEIVVVVKK